jgi:hypothetical protein
MVNLHSETQLHLAEIGKTPADIRWVGSRSGGYSCSWSEFVVLAHLLDYDSGYGSAEIARDLVIVYLDNTWSDRREYDGSEWWEHNKPPKERADSKPVTSLRADFMYGGNVK